MPKNVITLDGKRALGWKNFKLANEKGKLGRAKVCGSPVVLRS